MAEAVAVHAAAVLMVQDAMRVLGATVRVSESGDGGLESLGKCFSVTGWVVPGRGLVACTTCMYFLLGPRVCALVACITCVYF